MKSLNQKSILVTGGSGFIGSHLCENLLSSGNNVICVDNLFSSNKNNINRFINNEILNLQTRYNFSTSSRSNKYLILLSHRNTLSV